MSFFGGDDKKGGWNNWESFGFSAKQSNSLGQPKADSFDVFTPSDPYGKSSSSSSSNSWAYQTNSSSSWYGADPTKKSGLYSSVGSNSSWAFSSSNNSNSNSFYGNNSNGSSNSWAFQSSTFGSQNRSSFGFGDASGFGASQELLRLEGRDSNSHSQSTSVFDTSWAFSNMSEKNERNAAMDSLRQSLDRSARGSLWGQSACSSWGSPVSSKSSWGSTSSDSSSSWAFNSSPNKKKDWGWG